VTKNPVHKIILKQHGGSTLGGRNVWFDYDVLRLNYDERGEYLGEFQSNDSILVVLDNGDFYLTNFDLSNHYENNIRILEKYDAAKIWTAILYDADQHNQPYIKRFSFDANMRRQNYLGENKRNRLILLTDEHYARLEVLFGGHDAFRQPLIIDADEFVPVRTTKAHGKRLTTYTIETVNELEPVRREEPVADEENDDVQEQPAAETENLSSELLSDSDGQMNLF
jgi:topoisomerase-4 subunit A